MSAGREWAVAKGEGRRSPSLIGVFCCAVFAQAQAGAQAQQAKTDVEEGGNAFLEHLGTCHPLTGISSYYSPVLGQCREIHLCDIYKTLIISKIRGILKIFFVVVFLLVLKDVRIQKGPFSHTHISPWKEASRAVGYWEDIRKL